MNFSLVFIYRLMCVWVKQQEKNIIIGKNESVRTV